MEETHLERLMALLALARVGERNIVNSLLYRWSSDSNSDAFIRALANEIEPMTIVEYSQWWNVLSERIEEAIKHLEKPRCTTVEFYHIPDALEYPYGSRYVQLVVVNGILFYIRVEKQNSVWKDATINTGKSSIYLELYQKMPKDFPVLPVSINTIEE